MTTTQNTAKQQSAPTVQRWNAARAMKRLTVLLNTTLGPDARYYVLSLDLHRFHLDRDLLLWHISAAMIRPLRTAYAALRYVYAIQVNADGAVLHLVTDAPHDTVLDTYARFWLHGSVTRVVALAQAGASTVAVAMTAGIYGAQGARVKRMYTPSRNLRAMPLAQ